MLELFDHDPETAVRAEAARALAAFDSPTIPKGLLADWKKVPAAVRPDIVNTLATPQGVGEGAATGDGR